MHTNSLAAYQQKATDWFRDLRGQLCAVFEEIEAQPCVESGLPPGRFTRTSWQREKDGGGGEMALLRGRVLEKAGVNISTVWGEFPDAYRGQIPGTEESPRFWAGGISVVAHPRSPLMPAAHFNTRLIVTGKHWWGGGGDLTPVFPVEADTALFHDAFRRACDAHHPEWHARYKSWCDEYFFLPHRGEPRGVGGIFYDYHDSASLERDFALTQDVGRAFLEVYPQLLRQYLTSPWNDEQRAAQLRKRGRYVEFNLLYDRGTLFGLKTGGNIEAILMSLPPMVEW